MAGRVGEIGTESPTDTCMHVPGLTRPFGQNLEHAEGQSPWACGSSIEIRKIRAQKQEYTLTITTGLKETA